MTQVTRRRTLDATAKTTRRKLTAAETATKQEAPKVSLPQGATTPASLLPTADQVTAVVPHQFRLTIDHHHDVVYEAGTVKMPREHAESWWAKANGVTIAK